MTPDSLPPLAEFLRWMVEMPEAFRAEPEGFAGGTVAVHAVVADLFDTYFGDPPDEPTLARFLPANRSRLERNRLRWVLAACRLLWHPSLRTRSFQREWLTTFLADDLLPLAGVAPAEGLLTDEERREELIRRAFLALGLLLPGETEREAEDRLTQVDSVERQRLLREAAEKEKRAREVREAMARRAAAEAAARYGSE